MSDKENDHEVFVPSHPDQPIVTGGGEPTSEQDPRQYLQRGPAPPDDPWAHRSAGMRCRTCMWFMFKDPSQVLGRCKKHAPTASGYPPEFATGWCGDHRLDENKV